MTSWLSVGSESSSYAPLAWLRLKMRHNLAFTASTSASVHGAPGVPGMYGPPLPADTVVLVLPAGAAVVVGAVVARVVLAAAVVPTAREEEEEVAVGALVARVVAAAEVPPAGDAFR
mmetsp:Transcript_64512/g.150046  ORF Transcript_64512/g.150046 Transcript_64512/m.150046 type:complete len:117 (-) Transcript_64512:527-877(-)